jgi:phage/plasmid-associated DNA primase
MGAKGSRYFIESRDPQEIKAQIKEERAQILYYLARIYRQLDSSIPESEECLEAKRHYVDDNNDIVKFLNDFCEYDESPDNGVKYYFTPTKDITNFYNEENNTRYSSKFVVMRLKEVFRNVEMVSKNINGKLTRGLKNIRLIYGAYPEGYEGNFSVVEREKYAITEGEGF